MIGSQSFSASVTPDCELLECFSDFSPPFEGTGWLAWAAVGFSPSSGQSGGNVPAGWALVN